MKKLLFAIAALFCTTLSFAQEYMIIENTAGGWTSIDVSVISQAYFKTYPASGQGTKENPFNVAAANEKCKEIGSEPSTEKYYVKGIVVNNSNGVYAYIADDESGANRLYVYKLTVPEGITLNKNDEVIIYGVLYHFRNLTTEMEGELVSINGQIISGNDIQTVPISDVIAGEDGVTYSVRGEVTQIANPTWGNFYMKDETGELYIYGTLDATGAPKNFESLGIEVGDIVTVMGPRKDYNGTVELVNVRVLKIEKPVITAKGSGTLSDPYNVQAALDYINTLGADTPSEQDVYIKGYVTNIVEQFGTQYGNATFRISDTKSGGNSLTFWRGLYLGNVKYSEGPLLNEGDEVIICGKVVNFKGTTPETVQGNAYIYSLNGKTEIENGGGAQSDEVKAVTIAQFKAAAVSSDVWYQLTGIVVNLKENDLYGNFDLVDATDSVYVYGLLSEKGGEKKKFQNLVAAKGIKEGSKITIIGTRGVYNGKIEVLNAYFVSIEGEGGGNTDTAGTLAKPFTPAEANEFVSKMEEGTNTDKDYYIKGKIVKYANNGEFGTQYGNASFYISIDGTEDSEQFNVFRTLYLGNVKYSDDSWVKPAIGDEVIICGKLTNYRGTTPETVANQSYIYSLNGKTEMESGGSTPTPSDEAKAVSIAQFNEAAESTEVWYQLTGTISNLKDGDLYGNFDLTDETGSVYVYGLLSEKGGAKKLFQELVAAKGIKNGSKITIIGNRGAYKDKIEVLNAYFVSIEGEGGGGNTETTGTLAKPFTPTEANEFVSKMEAGTSTDTDYYIKGKIVKYANNGEFGTQYGNSSFYISVDGKEDSEQFYVYRTLYLGNVKYSDNSWLKPQVGDEVIICGKLTSYNGIPETAANKSYIYSLNGKTEIQNGGSGTR